MSDAGSPTLQALSWHLNEFWGNQGCAVLQPYDMEKGAGTMNPNTFFRVLGPDPWRVAYLEPSRRPADGRYGKNPNRLYQHLQFQVVLKPSPADVQDLYLDSLRRLGLRLDAHDVRFVEDNWEAPTLGAWGVGWEVWLDGMEITQFTYFQQMGGFEVRPVAVEITYGLERIGLFAQGKDDMRELLWTDGLTYGELYRQNEFEQSSYAFEAADIGALLRMFDEYERESARVLGLGLILPAYEYALKCSHAFNLLDARGALSVTQRTDYITRVRALTRRAAVAHVKRQNEATATAAGAAAAAAAAAAAGAAAQGGDGQ